jgi:hypothetical protein
MIVVGCESLVVCLVGREVAHTLRVYFACGYVVTVFAQFFVN